MHRVWNVNDPNLPADAVYVGHRCFHPRFYPTTCWKNPFLIQHYSYAMGEEGARAHVLALFEPDAIERLLREPNWLDPLIDHDLLCHCAPIGQPLSAEDPLHCHGQILLQLLARPLVVSEVPRRRTRMPYKARY